MSWLRMLRGLVLIGLLVVVAYVFDVSYFGHVFNESWVDHKIRGQGLPGELLYVGIGALAVALAVPRQIVSFIGGYAFGFIGGVLLAVLATACGCMLTFFYARLIKRGMALNRLSPGLQRIDEFLKIHPFSMTLLIRLLPVGNNFATNIAAGVSSVSVWPFLAGSVLGFIPQTAVFALVGSGVNVDQAYRIGLGVLLFVISGVMGVWLYHKYARRGAPGVVMHEDLLESQRPANLPH